MSEENQIDQPRIAAAVREILFAIGEDPDRDGLVDTPKRVAKAYAEFFAGLHQSPAQHLSTTFDIEHDELVLVKTFRSTQPANTTWCRSSEKRTSGTSQVRAEKSRAYPSSRVWSRFSHDAHKFKNASRPRSSTPSWST